jgi:predicted nicotinamide N-methyase
VGAGDVRDLERRFRTVVTTVSLGARSVDIVHPASAEELISAEEFAADERLPYWADLWPSAFVLARRVAAMAGGGRRLLELGCGAGLVSVAAAAAGFAVTATDYYADALRFARVNAARNAGVQIAARLADWRDWPADLARFDVVLASDVLYERPYAAAVAGVFARALAESGVGLVADPGRVAASAFAAECESRGLRVTRADRVDYADGDVRQTIDLYEITHAPATRTTA